MAVPRRRPGALRTIAREPSPAWAGGTTWQERQAAGPDWRRELDVPRVGAARTSPRPDIGPGVGLGPNSPFAQVAGAYNEGTSAEQTARNEYLNTLAVGGPREQAMNKMGYWTGGERVRPPAMARPNQEWLNATMENVGPGSIYQYQDPATGAFAGIITGGGGEPAQWQGLRAGGGGGGRPRPGVRPPSTGAGPGGRLVSGRPVAGRPGGGRPNPRGQNAPGGMPNQGVGGGRPRPGGGPGGGAVGGQVPIPNPQPPEQFGMPLDPAFEATRRGIEDNLAAALAQYGVAREQIKPMVDLMLARLVTNRGLDEADLQESLIGRGISQSSIAADDMRELGTQYERQQQDIGLQAGQQYADIAAGESGAQLAYNQQLLEALLASAQNAVANPNMRQPFAGSGRGGYGPAVGQGTGAGGGRRGRRARRGRR
jgi:hypothetical protein